MFNYDKLTNLAEEKGLSLNKLSQSIGRSRQYLYAVRDHKVELKKPDIKKLAEVLGTTYEYLVDLSDDIDSESTPTSEAVSLAEAATLLSGHPSSHLLFSALRNASDEDIARAAAIINALKDLQ